MLPFATYNIPESTKNRTAGEGKWLWILTATTLSEEDKDLLQKICTALKASYPDEVLLIEAPVKEENFFAHAHDNQLKLILSFGVQPAGIGLWIDIQSQGIRFLESFTFILTSSLKDLSRNPGLKKQLWASMQSFLEKK